MYNNLVVKLYLFSSTFRVCNAANLILILFAIIYNIHLQTWEDNFFCSTHNFFLFSVACITLQEWMRNNWMIRQFLFCETHIMTAKDSSYYIPWWTTWHPIYLSATYAPLYLVEVHWKWCLTFCFAWYFHRKSGEFL